MLSFFKNKKIFYLIIFLLLIFFPAYYTFALLSCQVTTSASCTGTVIMRMSGNTNAHAELPTQATPVYDNNVVCCTGGTSLGNSCSGNYEVVARLSGVTNAHVEKNTESGVNYNEKVCLSSDYAGDQLTIGYQPSDCAGYDTTLFSMASTPTNSMVGDTTAYNNKVCASVVTQYVDFSISDHSVGFGLLSSSGLRYATGDNLGSDTEVESYNIKISTNAPSGYSLYVTGDTLRNEGYEIDAIGGVNLTPTSGENAFGIRAVASGGVGEVLSPYVGSGFAYDATENTLSQVAEASYGDENETTYSVRTVASIDEILNYGEYQTTLTYILVPNF